MLPCPRRSTSQAFLFLAVAVLIASIALLNVMVLLNEFRRHVDVDKTNALRRDYLFRRELMETHKAPTTESRYPRTLVGIFSRDDEAGAQQRLHYRHIMESRSNDPRICNIPQFRERQKRLQGDDCMLVYTFVIGAHSPHDTSFPTEIADIRSIERKNKTVLVDHIPSPNSGDVNLPDVTRLDIR